MKNKILLVDDEPNNLHLLRQILKNDYDLVFAKSGADALLNAADHLPDLILLDVMMPDMDGHQVCHQLKLDRRCCDIPVIFVTAMSNEESEATGFRLGAVDYISKPLRPSVVKMRVRSHLALSLAQRLLVQKHELLLSELAQRELAEAALQSSHTHLSETLATLKKTQDELIRSERLAALGLLVSGVAHDLNTPIGNALTSASTLAEVARRVGDCHRTSGLKRSEFDIFLNDVGTVSELVCRNLARANEQIQRFKQVNVAQSSDWRQSFLLHELIEQTVGEFGGVGPPSPYQVEISCPQALRIDGFPGGVIQLLSNLLSNAVRHGFSGMAAGIVRIVALAKDDNQVTITFSDNGVGIAKERLVKVFDPYGASQLSNKPSGLGLYIVYNLVCHVLGGRIAIESELGSGTTLTIDLPTRAPDLGRQSGF